MGFLDSLKEIGFGNTGPYGRMDSGATNYANYARQRQGFESERGVTQALALAAKDGTEIPFNTQVEIAEKWGVPLNTVIQRTKGINEGVFAEKAKKKLHTAAQLYMSDKKMNQGFVPDEKYLMKLFERAGISDPRIMGMAKDAVVKLKDQSKTMAVGPYDDVLNITGNKANVIHSGKEKPAPEGRAKTSDLPDEIIDGIKYKVQRNTDGKKTYTKVGATPSNAKPTFTEAAYQQHIKQPGNENVTRADFKKNVLDKETGNLSDNAALEMLQNHAYTQDEALYPVYVSEFEALRKKGKSRNEAVDEVLNTKYRTAQGMVFKEVEFGQWRRIK